MEQEHHLFKSRHIAFQIAILLKGLDGLLEIAAGLVFSIVRPEGISRFVFFLTHGELAEDPGDFLSNQLVAAAHLLTPGTELFLVFYLFVHGAVKVFLVGSLWHNKAWAYPASLGVLSVFLFYQIFRVALSHSPLLLVFSVVDAVIIWLIWRDWQGIKRRLNKKSLDLQSLT